MRYTRTVVSVPIFRSEIKTCCQMPDQTKGRLYFDLWLRLFMILNCHKSSEHVSFHSFNCLGIWFEESARFFPLRSKKATQICVPHFDWKNVYNVKLMRIDLNDSFGLEWFYNGNVSSCFELISDICLGCEESVLSFSHRKTETNNIL